MIVAETDRLIISKFTTDDASFFMELVNTPNWIKFIGDRHIDTLEKAANTIKEGHLKSYNAHGFGFYKLLLKSDGLKPIGTCGLIKRDSLEHPDIGFAFLPAYEGFGYGYESSIAILGLAEKEFQLDTVYGITLQENARSIRLLEKLGLSYQKMVKPFDDDQELLLFAKTF